MSETHVHEPEPRGSDRAPDSEDPVFAALARLPARPMDGDAEARLRRQARAAYARSLEGSAWRSPALSLVGRVAVPVLLAGIVGVYMTWAITAATALLH